MSTGSWSTAPTGRASSPMKPCARPRISSVSSGRARDSCFDAFSSREPVPTSLENAMASAALQQRPRLSKAAAPWHHASVWRSTGTCMTTQRRSYETGHKPKCLVIVDDTAEWDRAVYYASRWAVRVGGGVVMLRIIAIEDQNQQWLGVADLMRAEAEDAANEALDRAAGRANGIAAITHELALTRPPRKKTMFFQPKSTPNPATLKFIPGRTVLDTGTMEFSSREAAARSPLAERLFEVPGISGVFYGYDFVTVTKADGDWQQLKPAILGAIMEHYMSGAPLLADGSAHNDEAADEEDEFFNESDADTVAQIKDLIETRVRPAVANDGGDITFRGFRDGVVYLNMKGSCAGCPSSTATLQHGIQNLLRHFVPDVVEVRPM